MYERLIGTSCEKWFVCRLEGSQDGYAKASDRFQTMMLGYSSRYQMCACEATWQFPERSTLIQREKCDVAARTLPPLWLGRRTKDKAQFVIE